MKNKILFNFVLLIFSSLLYYFSWPPSHFNFLLLFCFVPVYHVVFQQNDVKKGLLYHYIMLLLAFIVGHLGFFEIEDVGTIELVIGFIIIPLIWLLPMWGSLLIQKKYGKGKALFMLPFLYVSFEVFQYYWGFSVTWLHLGFGFSNTPLFLKSYAFFGLEGTTLFIIALNASIVHFIDCYLTQHNIKKPAVITASILGIYFGVQIIPIAETDQAKVKIAVFQPTLAEKEAVVNKPKLQIEILTQAIDSSKNSMNDIDLLICPETYFSDMNKKPLVVGHLKSHPIVQQLYKISREKNCPILAGAVMVKLYKSKTPPNLTAIKKQEGLYYDLINGALFITPNGEISWSSKQKLMPFTEKMPFNTTLNWLHSHDLWFQRYEGSFSTLPQNKVFSYKKLKIATSVCYEAMYPEIMNNYIADKANLQVVLSTRWTESEWLTELQKTYLNICASSFNIPLVFASLHGESTVSSPTQNKIKSKNNRLYTFVINTNNSKTPYSFIGKNQYYWIVLSIILLILSIKHTPKTTHVSF